MWMRNAVGLGDKADENQDSDQSISEEEEGLESEWKGNTISLGEGENKGALQVLSRLEILRESWELHSAEKESSSHGKKGGYHIEDEVEIPVFDDGDGLSHYHRIASATLPHSNHGMIYLPTVASISHNDDERIEPSTSRSARENFDGIWSEASREVEALVRSNEKSSGSSRHDVFTNERKTSKGGGARKKAKPKFLFPSRSHEKNLSLVVSDSSGRTSSDSIPLAVEMVVASDEDTDDSEAESQLNFHDEESELLGNHIVPFELAHKQDIRWPMVESVNCFLEKNNQQGSSEVEIQQNRERVHDIRRHSMVEFLNCFLDRGNQQGSSEVEIQKKRRRVQTVLKENTSPSDDVILDDDSLPDALDGGYPFQNKGEEDNGQSVKSIIPRTMANQFHEAFETASTINDRLNLAFPRPLCELYRKLQQVIQTEKEKDMDSIKYASAGMGFKDEGMSVLVRILSRSLEGKLIVCSCSSVEKGKNSYWESNLETIMKSVTRNLTIIFNPRMCGDVDLEVGNLIRVHPPWKEVQVKDEVVVLCTYFYAGPALTNSAEQGIVEDNPNLMNSPGPTF
ncbi:hypothetical protein ACS0TY_007777 [Phlomoides rotata]